LESSGEVVKVDSGLCQPAGTPILVQTGRKLGVTFVVDVETDVLRPIHVSVERIIVFLTHVQAAFNTLTVVFSTADATRLARVALIHFYDFNTIDFRLVFENVGEAVERPAVQVKLAVPTPVLRLAIVVLSNTSELPNVDSSYLSFDTPFNDVFRQGVEEVGTALRPLVM
jgi:hypothetical protein